MASISTTAAGLRIIVAMCPDGKRRPVRLGKVTMATAKEFHRHVEHLAALQYGGTLPQSTGEWLAGLGEKHKARLDVCGLLPAGMGEAGKMPTLSEWTKRYIDSRADVKPGTQTNYKLAERNLLNFFKHNPTLDKVTAGAVADFNVWLRTKQRYSEGSARRLAKRCKQFFAAAVRHDLLIKNPFDGIKCSTFTQDRFHFVTEADARLILESLPDAKWRLLFVLARWGGLRVPSEIVRFGMGSDAVYGAFAKNGPP